jgi:hypothetical protein
MPDPPIAARAGYTGQPRGLKAQDHANRAKSAPARDQPPQHRLRAGLGREKAYIGVPQGQRFAFDKK